jgi:hypothetical protein
MRYDRIWWTEWVSTAILIYGCILNAWNVFPENIYWCLAGNFGWAIVAISWRKWSLLVIQGVVSVIYVAGVYKLWL